MKYKRLANIAIRVAYALVFVVNVQCAVSLFLWPESYAPSYELSGTPAMVAVRGLGVAFLMWNATYPAVIVSPTRFRSLAVVVLVQQVIGLVGELMIFVSIPAKYSILSGSITRFIIFDAIGLVIMAAAFIWFFLTTRKSRKSNVDNA